MKFQRVLLINPPSGLYRRDERCQSKVEDQTVEVNLPPMDLLYMASAFEAGKAVCKIKDYPVYGENWGNYKKDLLEFNPDAVVVSCTTPSLKSDLISARLAKEINKDIVVIAKGGYFFQYDDEVFLKYPELDIIVRHEYEFVAKDIGEGKDLESIDGVSYKSNGRFIRNSNRNYEEELDQISFPARHLIDNGRYVSPENGKPITVIQTSKGCPNRCIFCPAGVISGYKVRFRSPENVVKEIKECINEYNIKNFLFNADTFTWSKKWVIELCQLIVKEKLNVRWGCNSKVNTIDKDRLEWMKKAGCWIVGFGIETGNKNILKKINKGTTLDQARNAVQLCKQVGVKSHTFYVIGLPWENKESLNDTLDFANELDADYFDFNIASPLPGTKYWEIALENNLFEIDDLDKIGYAASPVNTYSLKQSELIKYRKKMLMNLYLRPKYVLRTLANQIGSPGKMARYVYFGVKKIKYLLTN